VRTELIQEASDVRGTTDGHDGNALGVKMPTTARCERFERELVADPFDQDDRTWTGGFSDACLGV
jgi:hypothetical protein